MASNLTGQMTNEIAHLRAPAPDGITQIERAIEAFGRLGNVGFFPKHVQSAGEAAALAALGASYGLDPLAAVFQMHLIEGRPSLPAALQVGLIQGSRKCEYWLLVESTDAIATYETQRVGDPSPTRISYTRAEAERAGLWGKRTAKGGPTPWVTAPAAMLRARAASALARIVYPDVIGGLYDPDESREAAGAYAPAPNHTESRAPYRAPPPPAPELALEVEPSPEPSPAPEPSPETPWSHPALSLLESRLWPDAPADLSRRVPSSSRPGVAYLCQRLAPGAWACTCEAGQHTARGQGSPCHHAMRCEMMIAAQVMPPAAYAIVRAEMQGGPETASVAGLARGLETWRGWHDAELGGAS